MEFVGMFTIAFDSPAGKTAPFGARDASPALRVVLLKPAVLA
jgi:hypothetical protein